MPKHTINNGKEILADRKAYRHDRVLMKAALVLMVIAAVAIGFVTAAGIQIVG